MLNRQKIILLMLQEAGGFVSRLQLMKWSFLLAQETPSRGGKAFYQFLPYHFGPFSFSLYQEVDNLIRDGLVEDVDGGGWEITPTASQAGLTLPRSIRQDVSFIMDRYNHLSIGQLRDSIYSRYPWFTVNSKIIKKRAQARPVTEPAVYTMGYEGLMVDGFLNRLMKSGIQRLIDVRHNPVSRRYGFHKSTLARLCGYLEIGYCHLPELGIPSENRRNLQTPSDYIGLFDYYQHILLPHQTDAVRRLAQLLREKPGVLVCMEADPSFCHRSYLASAVAPIADLPVTHLGWPR
jgi:uncharacterized phage-associated protein